MTGETAAINCALSAPHPGEPALLVIVGATGTGKSSLALDLAAELGRRGAPAEIVNADAMQLYRGMDIGTAKVPELDRRGIPHHLLDVLEVTDEAAVADYQRMARAAITDIRTRGRRPILVGGSGLYVSSVLGDFRFPGRDPRIRARLERDLDAGGAQVMHRRLAAVDAAAADAIGPRNGRRLVRALEVVELTGEPFGSGLPDDSALWTRASIIGLRRERAGLVAALDERVERMWRHGLLDEVRALLPAGLERAGTAGRAIGYAQALAQLTGELTESEAIESTRVLTRRYARRQVGWFRRYRSAEWFDSVHPDLVSEVIDSLDRTDAVEPLR